MFLEKTTTIFVEAIEAAFDAEHPFEEMRDISVHTEYPIDEASYPGMWVNFVPGGDVRNVGIGHIEYYMTDAGLKEFYRWQFSGVLDIVVAALSSLERARMADWLAKTIAFGRPDGDGPLSDLRNYVDTNDWIGLRVIWEAFTLNGSAETPGTPWGTDDVVYEITLSLTVEGEVCMDPNTRTIVPLSAIVVADELSLEPVEAPPSGDGWR